MKHSLRVWLLAVLLGLTTLTAGAIGVVSYLDARDTATDLTEQVLAATSERIARQVDEIVGVARRQADLNDQLLAGGVLVADSPATLVPFWEPVLAAYPALNALYLTNATDGATVLIFKAAGGAVRVQWLVPRGGDRFELYAATAEEAKRGQKGRLLRDGRAADIDPRLDPWFREPRQAGKAVWIDTESNIDDKRDRSMASVTYASPLRGPGGAEYVLGLDFYLLSLCDYLRTIRVSDNGLAFLAERQRDGRWRVVAHPDADVVLPPGRNRLVPPEELGDARVRTFLERALGGEAGGPKMVRFRHDGGGYFGVFHPVHDPGGAAPDWSIGMVLPETDVLARAERNRRRSLLAGGLVLLLAVPLSLLVARQVSRPVEQMAREVAAVGRLDLDPRPSRPSAIREVGQLQRAIDAMKTSLASFRKYVPADLVAQLMAGGPEAGLGGRRRTLTVSFSDIENFTGISESLGPEQLAGHLGEYLQVLSDQILATGGTVDKYIGDSIMAFWGAPGEVPNHALEACRAALLNQQALAGLRGRWEREGKPPFRARIGVNTGEVVVGNVGSARRMNYTVLGDAVNLASRLEGLNKEYGTQILISEATFEAAKGGVVARPLGRVAVRGKTTAVMVYELLGMRGETPPGVAEMADTFTRAMDAYHRHQWAEALGGFDAVLERWPEDAPTREMLRRCEGYRDPATQDGGAG